MCLQIKIAEKALINAGSNMYCAAFFSNLLKLHQISLFYHRCLNKATGCVPVGAIVPIAPISPKNGGSGVEKSC